jgi:hypothetical protein
MGVKDLSNEGLVFMKARILSKNNRSLEVHYHSEGENQVTDTAIHRV